jgi:iron(III) transport system permease protein
MSGGATNGRVTDGRAMSGHVMARRGAAWCVGGTIAALLLPWYAGGGFSAGLAAQIIGGGHAWLWPMLLPLLFVMATLFTRTETIEASGIAADDPESEASHSGTGSDRAARVLIGAAAFGLIWLPLESGLIGAHGWTLPIWHGAWQPSQGSLGWGALVFALLCGTALAHGLARLGYGGGQDFVTVSLLLILGSILVFVAWPILCVLVSAVRDDAGAIDLVLFLNKFTAPSIWSLGCLAGGGCGVAWNSVALAVLVGAVTTLLGLAFALLAVRTALPMKPLLRGLSILPIVTPPFVIGLSLILLFGRAGMVTNWLALHAGIPRSRWIYGMPGIGIAQVLAFTPIAFLILVGMLNGISPTLEEASRTLRASPWRTFRTVTWPLLRPGLTNAFLIGFVESLADFANPLVIGGNFAVLSTDIFFAVVGAAHDQGRAAVLALILLGFTLAAFAAQRWWLGHARYTTISGKGDAGLYAPLPPALTAASLLVVLPWLTLTIAAYGTILVGGFVEQIGRDNTPTARYFWTAFSVDRGVGGWFLSGSAWPSFITTVELSLVAMPITAALGVLTAYLLDRVRFRGRQAFEFLTMMSFAIPGTVIGIGYILAFNTGALQLTGTATIIVAAFVFRNMPVGVRATLASLSQIDPVLDEASLMLRAGRASTLFRVILPLLRPAITTAMTYGFVRAMTAVSAVIFLVTGGYNLATVYIVGRADVGEYGIAIVYSAVLIVFMMIVLTAIQILVGESRFGRRGAEDVMTP